MRECPKCRVISPQSAIHCDCGYDFNTGVVNARRRTSDASQSHRPVGFSIALLVGSVFAFEALLLCILWFEIPALNKFAGLLQIPSAFLAIVVPPPQFAPNGKRDFFVFMFFVQGCIFNVVAIAVYFLVQRVRRLFKSSNCGTTEKRERKRGQALLLHN